jgi:hypothetical protein
VANHANTVLRSRVPSLAANVFTNWATASFLRWLLSIESLDTHRCVSSQSQSQSHITTDNQSASPSWYKAPIWDPRPIFLSPSEFLLDSCDLLFCSALSD